MIVVDASVGGKWLFTVDESYRTSALDILRKHSDEEEKIIVPDLFFYEISNAVVTKTTITVQKISQILKKLFEINLSVYHPIEKDIVSSTRLAKKYQTSVYDMLYAVIAKRTKTILVTADEKFIQKTGFRFVKHIKDIKNN